MAGNLTYNEALLSLSMLITYQGGKENNHLIPVIFPIDSWDTKQLLSDPHVREFSGVLVGNGIDICFLAHNNHRLMSEAGVLWK